MLTRLFAALSFAVVCAAQAPAPTSLPALHAPTDAEVLATKLETFADSLHERLAAPDADLCWSPGSLTLCLSMLLPGARGETAQELQRLLVPDGWDQARTTKAVAALLAHLRAARDIELSVVHDLWPQRGAPLLADYIAAMRDGYAASVRPQPFTTDPQAARRAINDYVAKATKGRIVDLLAAEDIDVDTRLVLTNVLWLHAKWLHPFTDTRDGDFHAASGKVTVSMMHLTAPLEYAETDAAQVLRLRYLDRDYALDLALPKEGHDLAAAATVLQAAAIAGLALKEQPVVVALPRFRLEGSFDLTPALRAAGLVKTTTAAVADFSGIDGGAGKLYVDKVVQKTFLDVAEEGTEAAAATAVVMKRGGREPTGARFVADRPFAWALRDTKTGLVLMRGRLTAPKAVAAGNTAAGTTAAPGAKKA